MKITSLAIPDVKMIEPQVSGDNRGFFLESWNRRSFAEADLDYDFVQDNHSRSARGTLRGLHYQLPPCAQGKLVRVTLGEVFDVAVDIRRGSNTYGKWVCAILSSVNFKMLWIPPGFAHGFYVTSEVAEFHYKCTDYYNPDLERRIHWNDPTLAIKWPITGEPLLSAQDILGASFTEVNK